MAEEKKELILSLQFDTDEALKRAGDLRVKLDEDKSALAALNKEIYLNGEATAENRLQREKLEKSIREGTRARGDELRAVDAYIKATNGAIDADGKYNGSIKNLRGNLSFLTEQWNGLTRAERENKDVGGVLQKEIKRLSDELKDLEGSVGDTRRNVGNYTSAIEKAISGQSTFSDGIASIKDAFAMMKDSMGGASKAIKGVADAEGGVQKATMAMGLSLKALGIGLLITAIAGVVSYLSKFEEGTEKMEQVLSGLGAAVDVVLGSLGRFGEKIVGVFTSPIEHAKKLGDFLKLAFTDPKAALEKLETNVKSFQVDLGDLAEKAIKAGKAMADLTRRTQELEDAETAAMALSERQKGKIEELLTTYRDRSLSEKQRIANLKEAGRLEAELTARELKFAKEAYEIAKAKDKIDQANGKLAEKQSKAAAEAEVKLIQIQNASAVQRQQIKNRESVFLEELAEQEKKRQEEWAKKMEERKVKVLDYIQTLAKADEQTQKEWKDNFLKTNKEAGDAAAARWKEYYDKLSTDRKADLQKEADALIQRAEITGSFIDSMSGLVGQALTEQEFNVQQFAQNFLMITLDMLEKTVTAQVAASIAASTALSFAQSDSVATFGATGIARTIVLTALIKGGFAAFKGILSNLLSEPAPTAPSKSKMSEGGVLDGPSHTNGGITGTGRFANVEVEGNEIVLTKGVYLNPALRAVASQLNIMGGGKPLAPTNYAAMGGIISPSLYSGAAANVNTPAIDYNKLAKAISQQPIYVIPTEIRDKANAANARKAQAGLGKKAA